MDVVKKKRTVIRSLFTRTYTTLNESLEGTGEINVQNLLADLEILKEKTNELQRLDDEVISAMLEGNCEEEELEKEMSKADEYKKKFKVVSLSIDKVVNDQSNQSSVACSHHSEVVNKRKFKLPMLELAKFGGKIKDWITFWGQFRKIDDDPDIDSDDKFQYLLQATEPNSRARELVASFPPIGSNYKKALASLKARFGRDDLLVEYYVRELLKLTLTMNSSPSRLSLATIYDRIETQLRALETLNVATDNYAAMLFPLVESCLSEEVLRTWQRSGFSSFENQDSSTEVKSNKLNSLMSFLKGEVENEERISLAMQGFNLGTKSEPRSVTKSNRSDKFKSAMVQDQFEVARTKFESPKPPTAANLISLKPRVDLECCLFCKGTHQSRDCFKAQNMSMTEKIDILAKSKCCFACLKVGHIGKKCRTQLKCILCGGKHVPLMCSGQKIRSPTTVEQNIEDKEKENKLTPVDNNLSNANNGNIFLQTLIVKVLSPDGNRTHQVRVLMDPGSQRSYIEKSLAQDMKYTPTGNEDIIHGLFGGVQTKPCHHNVYKLRLRSMNEQYACNFDVLDEMKICGPLPSIHPGKWMRELEDNGVDFHCDIDGPVKVLIGADVYGKLLTGKTVFLQCGLVAIETHLGWIVTGKMTDSKSKPSMNVTSMFISDSVQKLWELDAIGIQDPYEKKSKEEAALTIETHFLESVQVNQEGRYEVRLPWIEGHPPVPRNFELAKSRLERTVRKLESTDSVARYDEVFKEWLEERIIEDVDVEDWDNGHYFPHRPVFKENSTTQVRPVFDASAKQKGNVSLNDCLSKGINLLELIPSILLRFRMNKVGVVSDIRKAFLQISLAEEDRDFVRFLWTDKKGNLKIYRHARVVFGVSSSPFLLGAVINLHLNKCKISAENDGTYSPATVNKLQKCFYVDNCVTSLQSRKELEPFIQEATNIFAKGMFDLRGWEYSDSNLNESTNTSVLGLQWDRKVDTLSVSPQCLDNNAETPVTRRTMLSIAQRIFDPIGVTCPISLCPKLMLQQSWIAKCDWDEKVGEEISKIFLKWLKEIHLLGDLKVPRWLLGVDIKVKNLTVHTFCDSSKDAYATAIFLRTEYMDYSVTVHLIQAKNRVAPIKTMTIPRLELMAATIGARLADTIRKEFDIPDENYYFWCDSAIVITWIRREEPWAVFVWNRVSEIRKLTSKDSWHHLPGELNPADLPSRGCTARQLLESKWWEGPNWLKLSHQNWPSVEILPEEEIVLSEKRKGISNILHCKDSSSDDLGWYYKYSNNFQKVVRTMTWVLRFTSNCRKPLADRQSGDLLLSETEQATKTIVKLIQQDSFTGISDGKIDSLCPFSDDDAIIRLKTKVTERCDSYDFRFPAVLPSKHPLVENLILYEHNRFCHIGVQGLLSKLRENYWILQGRRTIRRILRKCVQCRKYDSKSFQTIDPALPETRVRDACVFEITGIDFCGPLYLHNKSKVWICLFTCAVYRAVHLELTSSLSTDAFIRTLRRFIARRGRPAIIYSDNGTNFVGTENALKKIDWGSISRYSQAEKIEWRFNPPLSAWWGGWWERLIQLLKQLLKKTLGKASVSHEELETILCDCENVINSRPLTYISESPFDLVPITPNMFLHEIKEAGVPDLDVIDNNLLTKRVKYCQKLKQDVRRRFRNEYLGQLSLQAKKVSREVKDNEIVLVGNDSMKRIDWPLAKVESKIKGRDGKTRLLKLKTASGIIMRPIQRVFPLEIFTSEDIPTEKDDDKTAGRHEVPEFIKKTRCGRKITLPKRFV